MPTQYRSEAQDATCLAADQASAEFLAALEASLAPLRRGIASYEQASQKSLETIRLMNELEEKMNELSDILGQLFCAGARLRALIDSPPEQPDRPA